MARLDTGWHAHPKVMALSLAAMGLHAWSISYCDYARTDGFVPKQSWPAKPEASTAVKALVKSGLWEVVDGGYQLHDYAQYNRSKAQIEADQAATNDRKERWRERRSFSVPNGVSNGVALARAGAPGPGPGPGDVTSSSSSVRNSGSSPEVSGTSGARDTDPALLAEHLERLERLARERLQRQTTTTNF